MARARPGRGTPLTDGHEEAEGAHVDAQDGGHRARVEQGRDAEEGAVAAEGDDEVDAAREQGDLGWWPRWEFGGGEVGGEVGESGEERRAGDGWRGWCGGRRGESGFVEGSGGDSSKDQQRPKGP